MLACLVCFLCNIDWRLQALSCMAFTLTSSLTSSLTHRSLSTHPMFKSRLLFYSPNSEWMQVRIPYQHGHICLSGLTTASSMHTHTHTLSLSLDLSRPLSTSLYIRVCICRWRVRYSTARVAASLVRLTATDAAVLAIKSNAASCSRCPKDRAERREPWGGCLQMWLHVVHHHSSFHSPVNFPPPSPTLLFTFQRCRFADCG